MHKINLSNKNIRTDLIIEKDNIKHDIQEIDGLTITKTNQDGNYITISYQDITDIDEREKVGKHLEDIIKEIIKINKIKEYDSCLIIGLGNKLSTPDSLGPKVIENIVITRHLFSFGIKDGMRNVAAITPGVMGNTGIESSLIIKAIVKEIKPDFLICIDALASRSIDKINKTIQITDTGIHPGSGIGNNRIEISKKNLNIPVIAIGIPTVTNASVIVNDTINYLYKHISFIKENSAINKLSFIKKNYRHKLKDMNIDETDRKKLLGLVGELSETEQKNLIEEVLTNTELNLIVTPTEIDFLIDKLSLLLASSLNNALHRQINHY